VLPPELRDFGRAVVIRDFPITIFCDGTREFFVASAISRARNLSVPRHAITMPDNKKAGLDRGMAEPSKLAVRRKVIGRCAQ